jgi:CubicO group peptidase (beta-lactamase class C family)
MFINAYDQARFGLLTTRRYQWGDEQLLPVEWWGLATTPTAANPGYGFMNFYLNTERRAVPAAPESAWAHLGSGTNMIYCDPEHDLVVVARWIDGRAMAEFLGKVLAALD